MSVPCVHVFVPLFVCVCVCVLCGGPVCVSFRFDTLTVCVSVLCYLLSLYFTSGKGYTEVAHKAHTHTQTCTYTHMYTYTHTYAHRNTTDQQNSTLIRTHIRTAEHRTFHCRIVECIKVCTHFNKCSHTRNTLHAKTRMHAGAHKHTPFHTGIHILEHILEHIIELMQKW